MKISNLLLTLFLLSPALTLFAANDDYELNGGINYQSLLSQRQTEWRRREASLNQQINDLESQIASLRGSITILENDKKGLTRDNSKLADELANCRSGLSMNSDQQSTINQLNLNNASLTADNEALNASVSDLQTEVEKILGEKEALNVLLTPRTEGLAISRMKLLTLLSRSTVVRKSLTSRMSLS